MRRLKKRKIELSVPAKANKILNGILVVLVLVVVRIWHVAVIQHEEKMEASKKPQRRVVVEKAERATIRDRFNVVLATNKVQYNAAVSYGDIREIPRVVWTTNEEGKKCKHYKRREYISELAERLSEELDLDAERLEDIIHSKTSIFGNVPFIIKENISEREYFRLKMLEKDWPGIRSELVAKRNYPLGPVGGEVVGYLGAISAEEYEAVTKEMRALREVVNKWEEDDPITLPEGYGSFEAVEKRLKELEGKAYTINDYVGKAGIEGYFDEELRGRRGKRLYLSDTRGSYLRELPGSESPTPGNRFYLSISAELQEYAERLLTEYEQAQTNVRIQALRKESILPPLQPWIKGGAIVAMDPHTGEVLALASYPRFDPNDFIRSGVSEENSKKKEKVNRWLETENYLGALWDLRQSYGRERFEINKGEFFEEAFELTWDRYLNLILPEKSPVKIVLEKKGHVSDALFLQKKLDELFSFFREMPTSITPSKILDAVYQGEDEVATGALITLQEKELLSQRLKRVKENVDEVKKELNPFFHSLPLNEDKLLLADLYRLVVDSSRITPLSMDEIKKQTLQEFREASSRFVLVQDAVKNLVKDVHHITHFKRWRTDCFKDYLAEKRREEAKAKKKFGRPYIEYLDEAESLLFKQFWHTYRWVFLTFFLSSSERLNLTNAPDLLPYMEALETKKKQVFESVDNRSFAFHYGRLAEIVRHWEHQEIASYLKSLRCFEDLKRPLLGKYAGIRSQEGKQLEKHLAMAFYPLYGYGFSKSQAFRQAATIGSIFKLVPAYEALCQRYLHLQESGQSINDLNPLIIIDDKHRAIGKGGGWNVGFTAEGRPIPRYYHGGLLPRSEHSGIGRVDLVHALEVSSNPYFAMLSGDILEDPEDLCRAAKMLGFGEKTGIDLPGEFAGRIPLDVAYNRTGLYSLAIGQHSLVGTPLQTAVMLSALANGGKVLKPKIVHSEKVQDKLLKRSIEIKKNIFLPSEVRHILLKGMRQVIMGQKGTGRSIKSHFPPSIVQNLVGKTSTAEIVERLCLGVAGSGAKCKLVWFGAISFDPQSSQEFSHPDLVVVVYLRFGDFGREAAPLAAKMIQKWKEIQNNHLKFNPLYSQISN